MKTLIAALMILSPMFAQASRCPVPDSREERNLLLEDGPVYMETGFASPCLRLVINREKLILGVEGQDERDLVNVLMSAAIKAEVFEQDNSF